MMNNKTNVVTAIAIGLASALGFVGIVKIFALVDNQRTLDKYIQDGYTVNDNRVLANGVCRDLAESSGLPDYELFYYRCVDAVSVRLNARLKK